MEAQSISAFAVGALDRFDAPAHLCVLLKAWGGMSRDERRSSEGQAIAAEVRGIGKAAAYFGGWAGMQRLDHAVAAAGGLNSHLNDLWDGIGAWCA